MIRLKLQNNKNIIVTGHYGSGKTNFSLNLAMDFRKADKPVVLADLDIVNPYFRTADFRDFAEENGIHLVASDYAGSTLDIPALTARLDAQVAGETPLIVDVGGDDVGAYALGRYAPRFRQHGYVMLYLINYYRPLVRDPQDCVQVLREIETASRMEATHIVNCSNLGRETAPEDIRASLDYANRVAELTGLPLAMTAVKREVAQQLTDLPDLFPMEVYVTVPWN